MEKLSPLKIIITDDHSLFRNGIKASLQSKGDIEIIGEAIHGQDLLDKLVYLKPDMILMGISMPVMDGLTALPILRSQYPLIKVIIISMNNDSSIICRALERGATTYLTKESGAEKIHATILACRDRWFYINDIVQNAIANNKGLVERRKNNPCVMDLNDKEYTILKLLCKEKSLKEIAETVDFSIRTVEAVQEKLITKTGTVSTAGLIAYCLRNKIIEK